MCSGSKGTKPFSMPPPGFVLVPNQPVQARVPSHAPAACRKYVSHRSARAIVPIWRRLLAAHVLLTRRAIYIPTTGLPGVASADVGAIQTKAGPMWTKLVMLGQ